MTEPSFNFISINLPNPKPRSKGVTCVTDVMWTTSMMDDYLNDFEDIIDWVKIQNHRRTISTYDDKWFLKRNKTLAKHNVGSYIGGMVFEMAYVQGKHRQFFEKTHSKLMVIYGGFFFSTHGKLMVILQPGALADQ